MRLGAKLLLTVGAALLLANLTALWNPYDANWVTVMVGFMLIMLGAIIEAGLNLHDHEHD